jgi:hypothetical protein
MKKLILSLFIVVPLTGIAQSKKDEYKKYPSHVTVQNEFGQERQVKVMLPVNILFIDGDSIYNTLTDYDHTKTLIKYGEQFDADLVTHPDSIQKIIKDRIKGIIILRKKDTENRTN